MSESPEVYDPVDLRQRIVLCFTIGELRDLAEQLGVVGSVTWQRGIQEAARGVVQQCERYAGLPALVAKLREARPDMDWPTREPPPVAPAPAPAASEGGASATNEGGADASSMIVDPFAPKPPPTIAEAPLFAPIPPLSGPGALAPSAGAPASFASPPLAPTPAPRAQPSPVWPGTAAPGAPPSRGVDPRILIAVAGLMLLAAIVAYLAGRASNAPTATATPAASASSRRGDGPAALAADAIDRRIANLARVCELPPGADVGELVFARVFERCGPASPPRRRSVLPPEFDADAGAPPPAQEPPEPSPAPPPPPRAKRPGKATEAPIEARPAPARGCEGQCDGEHRACKQRCGPEPTESGGYEGWQRCMSRCLTDASRCRLACR